MNAHLELVKRFFEELGSVPIPEWIHAGKFLRITSLKKGELFFNAGEPATKVGLVTQGMGAVYYQTDDGKKAIRRFILPGQPCTSYPAVIREEPARDTFEAVADTTVVWLEYKSLEQLMRRHICWERLMRRALEREIEEREHKEYELFVLSATERYQRFRERFPKVIRQVPQHMVASYLGISPVALSRIKSRSLGKKRAGQGVSPT